MLKETRTILSVPQQKFVGALVIVILVIFLTIPATLLIPF